MSRVCIHGHFYQPDRTNPWSGRIDPEPSAAPYRNWNERILDECYRPNAAAQILGPTGEIAAVVSNYERISWNAGPSLMAWLENTDRWTYQALVAADAAGAAAHNGHGPAIAQSYVHAILPLAHPDDRRTMIRWGIADFVHRFGRRPEGMWLPEAAIDTATVECLIDEGIAFTVLAPWQAATGTEPLDTSVPYLLDVPSGRRFAAFFYDGGLSSAVAFGGLLHDGATFAAAIATAAAKVEGRLVHLATDGESYGHHHRHGEMALAFAIAVLADRGIEPVTYGHHLAEHPPTRSMPITDPSSWSCVHGVDRWRADCGDRVGTEPGWNQAWRRPLRDATDWLRDALATAFESNAPLDDPWAARDAYVEVLLGGDRRSFLSRAGVAEHDTVAALTWLESQRHGMLATESSAWFYDDAAGIEATLAMRHALRAIQLVRSAGGPDLEPELVDRLRPMRSNIAERGDGAAIWARQVVAAEPDLVLTEIVRVALGVEHAADPFPVTLRLDAGPDEVGRIDGHAVEMPTGRLAPVAAQIEVQPADIVVRRGERVDSLDDLPPHVALAARRHLLARHLETIVGDQTLAAFAALARDQRVDLAVISGSLDQALSDRMARTSSPAPSLGDVVALAELLDIDTPRARWWHTARGPTVP